MIKIFRFLLILFIINAKAQDVQINLAEDLLKELTEKWIESNVYAEYTESYTNKAQDISESNLGKIWIKNEMYRLERSNELGIINNGKTLWYVMKDIPEVQIMDNDPEDKLNPTKIFAIYKEGYKYEYKGEETIDNNTVHLISFYPEATEIWKEIVLHIDKRKVEISKIIMKDKEGGVILLDINKYVDNSIIDDSIFLFKKEEFDPDIEIIDLR